MPVLHSVVGPIGTGKSTYARRLAAEQRAVRIGLDDWFTNLFGPDQRPAVGRMEWYLERRERCLEQIWRVSRELLFVGTGVVLEPSLITRREREAFYARLDEVPCSLVIHVLDAPREVRRARVERRNQEKGETFAVHVPPELFERASDLWEPLDEDERQGRDVRFVR